MFSDVNALVLRDSLVWGKLLDVKRCEKSELHTVHRYLNYTVNKYAELQL